MKYALTSIVVFLGIGTLFFAPMRAQASWGIMAALEKAQAMKDSGSSRDQITAFVNDVNKIINDPKPDWGSVGIASKPEPAPAPKLEPEPARAPAPIDSAPPQVSASVSPAFVGINERISVSLTARDVSGVGIIQFYDGVSWQSKPCFGSSPCTWPLTISKSQPGTYVFYYSATDAKNNTTGSQLAGTVTVGDTAPPVVATVVLPNPAKTGQTISATVTAQDPSGVGVLWLYDGSEWFTPPCFGTTPCSRTHTFTRQQPGTYTLLYYAVDTKSNYSARQSIVLVVRQAVLEVDISSNKAQVQPGETIQLQWQVQQ